MLALWTILHGRSRWYLAVAGAVQMLAVAVYPTLALVLPVWAVCLLAVVGAGRLRALAAWAAGAAVTGAAYAALLVSFGVGNVARCVRYQLADARRMGQGGGFQKVHLVVSGSIRLIMSRPYILVIALFVYLIYQTRPGVRRLLVLLLPLALLAGGERDAAQVGRLRHHVRAAGAVPVPVRRPRAARHGHQAARVGLRAGAGRRSRDRLHERRGLPELRRGVHPGHVRERGSVCSSPWSRARSSLCAADRR